MKAKAGEIKKFRFSFGGKKIVFLVLLLLLGIVRAMTFLRNRREGEVIPLMLKEKKGGDDEKYFSLRDNEEEKINWSKKIFFSLNKRGVWKYTFDRKKNEIPSHDSILGSRKYFFFYHKNPEDFLKELRWNKRSDDKRNFSELYFSPGVDEKLDIFLYQAIDVAKKVVIVFCLFFILSSLNVKKFFSSMLSSRGFFSPTQDSFIPKIGFKDIGGCHEAKQELEETIFLFKNRQSLKAKGVTVPKGVLLFGPPGNGKTMLAKAFAFECGLRFIYRSGAEFEEMLVGVGARRVRELFEEARSFTEGAVIFIDEIDSIGKKRYESFSEKSDLTINQLLNEMDGFRPRDKIIVLAATNAPEIIDEALTRPGRFDRKVYIPLPNFKSRLEIVKIASEKLKLNKEINLEINPKEISYITRGLSGAQIVSLFSEASIICVRERKKRMDQSIFLRAYDRVVLGPELISKTISQSKKKLISCHEAGHAVIGLVLPNALVKKITIVPHSAVGGYTWITFGDEEEDDELINKKQTLAQITALLGGRISEELMMGSELITAGSQKDFEIISSLVSKLIFDFNATLENESFENGKPNFFSIHEKSSYWSEKLKERIAIEKEKIIKMCWKKALSILGAKKKTLLLIVESLLERNTLVQREINHIFSTNSSPFILSLPSSE